MKSPLNLQLAKFYTPFFSDSKKESNTGPTFSRISVSSSEVSRADLDSWGYLFIDRLWNVNIKPNSYAEKFDKFFRNEVRETNALPSVLIEKTKSLFHSDWRFNLSLEFSESEFNFQYKEYLLLLDKFLICGNEKEDFGFIALTEKENEIEVSLAAVIPNFVTSGAALNLYAYALRLASHRKKNLVGKISTKNLSVANLYSFLGARFSDSTDLYMKRSKS